MKKFEDNLNTAVITTKYVLENSPIVFVFHYDDGYWQFSGEEENLQDEDYRVVSLEEIIAIDSSVLEISNLPYNGKAYRETKSSRWKIESLSDIV